MSNKKITDFFVTSEDGAKRKKVGDSEESEGEDVQDVMSSSEGEQHEVDREELQKVL
jgi:hypothetical protein